MPGFLDKLFGGNDDDRVLREPEFAGVQYPDDANELREAIDRHLEASDEEPAADLRGLVVPYGDYRYAGPVMGAAYAKLAGLDVERVLLLAPSERVPFRGLAVAGYDGWSTPLGELEVDLERIEQIVEREDVRPIDVAFEPAAGLELQVPFLQRVAGEAVFAPVLVGDTDGETVASLLEEFWDEETLLVVSTQLSRGLARKEAEGRDRSTIEAIIDGRPDAIGREETSGRMAIRGAMQVAEARGWSFSKIAYDNSSEALGEEEKVVGYGALLVVR